MNLTLNPPSWSVRRFAGWLLTCLMAVLLAACVGDGDDNASPVAPALRAPTITTPPAGAKVTAPAPATFAVTATGSDPLTYQWAKNGTAIAGATSASYTTPATVDADNGALFTVVVSNSAGSVKSDPATLTVGMAVIAPTVVTQPVAQTVTAPATATFMATFNGTAPLTYQWTRNDVAIAGATAASYTTPATAVAADNGALYAVTATNPGGSKKTEVAKLTVNPMPTPVSIGTQPVAQSVTAPATATFSVTATGDAPISYQWLRTGTAIAGATAASYTTAATSAADNGAVFKVVVTNPVNSVPSADALLTVTVTPPPPTPVAITKQPADVNAVVGAAASFSVTATGTAPLAYQWFRNGLAISGATAVNYTTVATVIADSGSVFSVAVSNAVNSAKSAEATLTIQPGGNGGTGSTAGTSYVLAGLVDQHGNGSSENHHYVLYLVDPSNTAATTIVEDFGSNQPLLVYADAFELNVTTRTSLYKGAARVIYVKDKQMWAIDLTSQSSHSPRKISSTSVCGIRPTGDGYYIPLEPSAGDVLIEISDCADPTTRLYRSLVRSSMGPLDPALKITTNRPSSSLLIPLANADGTFVGMVAQDSQGMGFYDRDLIRHATVGGSAGLTLDDLGGGFDDTTAGQAYFLRIAKTLYRMTWTTASADLAAYYVFSSAAVDASVGDLSANYFVDGLNVMKQTGSTMPVVIATLSCAPIRALFTTDDRVIAQQSDGTGNVTSLVITSIAKTGPASPVVLESSNGVVMGTTSDSVLLLVGGERRLVKADGTGQRSLPAGGAIYDPLQRAGASRIAATVTCINATTASTNCSNGTIQETLLDGTTVNVGKVSHAVDYEFAVFGTSARLDSSSVSALGIPELITFYDAGSALTDLYLLVNGQANSLIRLTNFLP